MTEPMRQNLLARNEGNADRIVRILLGLALISLVFIGPQTMWGLVGIIFLATGLVGMCPLYRIFGFDTCGKQGCEA